MAAGQSAGQYRREGDRSPRTRNVGLTVTDSYLWLDNWYNKLRVSLLASGSLAVIPFGGQRDYLSSAVSPIVVSLQWAW